MRSSAHGSLASILLLLPILAIPLFAIFGIPEFAPVADLPLDEAALHDSTSATDAPQFAAVSNWESEPLPKSAPVADPVWGTAPEQLQVPAFDQRRSRPASTAQSSAVQSAESAAIRPVVWNEDSAAIPSNPAQSDGPQPISGGDTILTWKSAVQRLQQLEIRSYRLEPGRDPGQFTFICSYTPQHNPSVSYRFEAEADEPLRAVEKVLAQIDTWMAAR